MLMVRQGDNEDAKRQLMPIVRHLVQKVVIGKTPVISRRRFRYTA